ncbi:PREDICTED: uncharacterized protein LOC106148241 isoform X2 [Chinchilla lanigera]|uniref:uncharacterized protein LOC106148241 isoform X2 n=1 Tax=Chinchilla lanigera TaxID=34839 RepID=UPI000695C96C|nr:PREDICTED: uncharacterized protein LOC106148241 isoform X2 [Chinchilla lanigera]
MGVGKQAGNLLGSEARRSLPYVAARASLRPEGTAGARPCGRTGAWPGSREPRRLQPALQDQGPGGGSPLRRADRGPGRKRCGFSDARRAQAESQGQSPGTLDQPPVFSTGAPARAQTASAKNELLAGERSARDAPVFCFDFALATAAWIRSAEPEAKFSSGFLGLGPNTCSGARTHIAGNTRAHTDTHPERPRVPSQKS